MALPPSNASLGSTVGKRLFGTSNASVIKRKIESIDKKTLSAALKAQGIRGAVDARKVTQALTGEGRGKTKRIRPPVHCAQTLSALGKTPQSGPVSPPPEWRAKEEK